MDYLGIAALKTAYQNQLLEDQEIERSIEIEKSNLYSPISVVFDIHPEIEPNLKSINTFLIEANLDIFALNKEIEKSGEKFKQLIETTKTNIEIVEQQIRTEEERLNDLNIICSNYNELTNVKTLNKNDFTGVFSHDNSGLSFSAKTVSSEEIPLTVLQINGNGYSGNKYVWGQNDFLSNSLDTSDYEYITDSSYVTAFEYSRLTSNGSESQYPAEMNFDSEEAECSIILWSEQNFTNVNIISNMPTIVLKDMLISTDEGVTFKSVLTSHKEINNMNAKYENGDYAYGSGLLYFPTTKFLKLVFKSNGPTDEQISFINIDTTDAENPQETVIHLKNAKRHVIRINSITAKKEVYKTESYLKTDELITDPIKSIAIFANEYIPNHFINTNYFEYTLTVNGIDHNIVPINSQKSGIKIIKALDCSSVDTYAFHIDESIKSAYLTIKIITPNSSESPILSNLKVCLGKVAIADV